MSSRSLNDLTDNMRSMAIVHSQLCEKKGVQLLIYCTLRSNSEQNALYEIGRTKHGKVVTNARSGQSAHNPDATGKASAYDCCPLVHGKAVWDTNHPAWNIVGTCGEESGLVWSGRWAGKMKESAHFQDTKWRKLE